MRCNGGSAAAAPDFDKETPPFFIAICLVRQQAGRQYAMEMDKLALEWLYRSEAVSEILRQCEQQKETKKSIFKVLIRFDALELLHFSVTLGEAVLHRPGSMWPVFVEVVYTFISVVGCLPHLTSSSQLLLIIRLSSLPSLPMYRLDHVSDLSPLRTEPRFYCFSGVVTSISIKETYTEAACFQCSRESCPDSQRYIRLHTAGATEAMTMQDTGCYHCGHLLTEEVAHRVLADKVYMTLAPCCALSMCSRVLERHQSMLFTLRSDLCDLVHVGGEYDLVGVPTPSLTEKDQHWTVKTVIEVNNVTPVHTSPSRCLPSSLNKLFQGVRSPWDIPSSLTYAFANHICPPGTYHRVKLGILISLASVGMSGDKGIRPLSLVAVGKDTPLLTELMLYGGSLAERSTVHSTTFDLYGGGRKEGTTCFIDGGALPLAEGGICLLGNVGCFKREQRDRLERSLESGRVEISLPKRLGVSEMNSVSLPVHCAMWGLLGQKELDSVSKSLLDRLGLLLSSDPSPCYEDTLTETITTHVLDRAMGCTTTPLLSCDQLREVIAVSAGIEPSLDRNAEVMLESFYSGSRRVRGTDMPNTALDTMRVIALSHAKLRLSLTATQEDALLAILLYEECLIGRFGYSVINHTPSPHINSVAEGGCGAEFDLFMRGLLKRVVEFCKCSTHTSLYREE